MTNETGQSRRTVLGGMAAGAGLMSMAAVDQAHAQSPTLAKTFVLVHGAWHGGWCWRRVADHLEGKGHKVFTPTMTGLGERSHLLTKDINLATHITDIVNVIKWEDLKDIVLVGHSYGGLIISGVADQMGDKIASIVFLDAFVPENGDSLAEKASQPVRDAIAGVLQRGELGDEADAGFGIPREREGSRLGRRHVHAAPDRDLHRQGNRHRRARQDRQARLHPRQGLSERAVRWRAGEAQGQCRLEDLRVAVRS